MLLTQKKKKKNQEDVVEDFKQSREQTDRKNLKKNVVDRLKTLGHQTFKSAAVTQEREVGAIGGISLIFNLEVTECSDLIAEKSKKVLEKCYRNLSPDRLFVASFRMK